MPGNHHRVAETQGAHTKVCEAESEHGHDREASEDKRDHKASPGTPKALLPLPQAGVKRQQSMLFLSMQQLLY